MWMLSLLLTLAQSNEPAIPRSAESEHYRIEVHGSVDAQPALSPPPRGDERWFSRRSDADEALAVLEAAWPQYVQFFGTQPKLAAGERLRVSLHQTSETMLAAIRAGGGTPPPPGPGGYYCPVSRTAFLFRQPTRWYTRALLIHEVAHQFHWLAGETRKNHKGPPPSWWAEGVVEHLAHHTWDGTTLRLAVVPPVSLEDYPARALAASTRAGFAWEELPTLSEDRPLQMHLVRWLATSADGQPTSGFRFLRERLDRGEEADSKAILKAAGLKSEALRATLAKWLPSVQQPYVSLFNEWDSLGPGHLRGTAGVVAACRTREDVASHAARLRVLHGGRWRAGLLVHFTSSSDHTIAVIDSGRELRLDRWNGGWTVLGVHALRGAPDAEGWWDISATRAAATGRVSITVGAETFGSYELPAGPMGLAIDASDVEFVVR